LFTVGTICISRTFNTLVLGTYAIEAIRILSAAHAGEIHTDISEETIVVYLALWLDTPTV